MYMPERCGGNWSSIAQNVRPYRTCVCVCVCVCVRVRVYVIQFIVEVITRTCTRT